jgi:hypothetical protein
MSSRTGEACGYERKPGRPHEGFGVVTPEQEAYALRLEQVLGKQAADSFRAVAEDDQVGVIEAQGGPDLEHAKTVVDLRNRARGSK